MGSQINVHKCKVMELGKGKKRPSWNYKVGGALIVKTQEKNLDTISLNDLSPEKYIAEITKENYYLKKVPSYYMDENMMKLIV